MTIKNHNHAGILTIDLTALKNNYNLLKKYAEPAEACPVLKADAYGIGANKVGKALFMAGARTFFVAHGFEGVDLRSYLGKDATIYVLHGCFDDDICDFIENNLIPIVSTNEQLEIVKKAKINFGIHINTGMCRYSLNSPKPDIHPILVMSHLSGGQNENQLKKFNEIAKNYSTAKTAISASCALDLGADYKKDLIRFGYGMYGMEENHLGLTPVISLKAKIIAINQVKKGDKVGYDETFTFDKDGKMATIAVGYADGYPRSLSNKGYGFVNGYKVPLIGKVSMDLSVFDVSMVKDIKIDDEIELIGNNIKINEVANLAGTIGYEILTSLGKRYKRIYK